MREVQGYPLPLGVQISENKINFSIAVPTEKKCQLLIYRAGRKRLYRQFEMETAVGEVLPDASTASKKSGRLPNAARCSNAPHVNWDSPFPKRTSRRTCAGGISSGRSSRLPCRVSAASTTAASSTIPYQTSIDQSWRAWRRKIPRVQLGRSC